MVYTGIVAEYNPFHNGHKLHMETAKKLTATENLFVIMSGNFTQRGEPAILNKYVRCKCALEAGAGIVAELPCVFASSGAEFFASAAVKILHQSNICQNIAFGAETDDILSLYEAAKLFKKESKEFKTDVSKFLSEGLSFALARQKAAEKSFENPEILASSNNILAIEYIKELIELNSKIKPIAIKRVGNDYSQIAMSGSLSSATAIRQSIYNGDMEDVKKAVDKKSFEYMENEIKKGTCPISFNDLSDILNYRLRSLSPKEIAGFHGISEGLENRILNSLKSTYNAEDICQSVKAKRYAYSRIQRALLHICLNITENDIFSYRKNGFSPYIRILGFRKDREYMLKEICEKSQIPVITNIKNAHKILDEYGMEILNKEIYADNIYSMLYKNKKYSYPNQSYTTPLVII